MRTRKRLLAFALFLASATPLISQGGRQAAPFVGRFEEPRRDYALLSNQIYSYEDPESQRVRISDKDQVAGVVAKLQNVIRGVIASVLNSPDPSAAAVVDAIHAVQGDDLGLHPNPGETDTPLAEYSTLNGSRLLLVAYTILRGGAGAPDSLPNLEFYRFVDGKWALQDTAPPDLTQSTLFIRRMAAGVAGEEWYLVWGNRIGDTGARLKVRLYGFNGKTVRTIWNRDDLTHGQVDEVSDGAVTISSEKVYRSGNRTSETLHVTPNGLQ